MALLAFLFCPVAALAQPRLVPDHDVTITYRLDGAAADQIPGGAPDGVRLQWDARGRRLRTEPVGRPTYAVTDLNRHVASIVFAGQNAMELPIKAGDPQALIAGQDVQFTRRGTGRVLGEDCTEWAARSRKLDVVGCVAADGVVLRADGTFDGRPGTATAIAVNRAPVPPDAFRVPAGAIRFGR